jgi:hypothetical protein
MFRRLRNRGLTTSDRPRTCRDVQPVLTSLEQRIALSEGRPGENLNSSFEEIEIEMHSEPARPTRVYVDDVASGMS